MYTMCRTRCVLTLIALYVGVVRSWDFATTKSDLLEFYTSGNITESVRFDSQNLTALIYNEVHNMMLYVNKQSGNDVICGYDISALEKKCFTERSGRNIHGLAFDPVTEKLFFSDTNERSINWITLKTGSDKNVYGNLLIKTGDGIPTDLAVDSCRGYVYWINENLAQPTIERAHFDGSKREVIITSVSIFNSNYKLEPHGLAIDQLLQKIYWMEPISTVEYRILYADLNGKNQKQLNALGGSGNVFPQYVYSLSVSKTDLYVITRRLNFGSSTTIFKLAKSFSDKNHQYATFSLSSDFAVSVAANYKLEDKLPEIQDCEPLTRLIRDKSNGPFCVHGTKVNEQSLCKCTPGYIGERCDVSVCNNYCVQGDCITNDEELPECICNAGYSGDRCEKYACSGYCQNNGDCSLNENSEPVCECKEDYVGDRCEVSDCLNYCIQGNCTLNKEGLPECRCNTGYSGNRCELYACSGYCQNNGDCSLNENSEPVCECKEDYVGDRCEVSDCLNYCIQGNCTLNKEGIPECRCNVGYTGNRCEVDTCYGYCLNNGVCSLNEEEEPFCDCVGNYAGPRCEGSQSVSFTFTNTNTYAAERNQTLADLLSNWRKPSAKIVFIVEDESD